MNDIIYIYSELKFFNAFDLNQTNLNHFLLLDKHRTLTPKNMTRKHVMLSMF